MKSFIHRVQKLEKASPPNRRPAFVALIKKYSHNENAKPTAESVNNGKDEGLSSFIRLVQELKMNDSNYS